MHIAVGNSSSTLRTTIITFLMLVASQVSDASYIQNSSLAFSNDRINNICFQKFTRTSVMSQGSLRDWRIDALAECRLTKKEIDQAFSKKFK